MNKEKINKLALRELEYKRRINGFSAKLHIIAQSIRSYRGSRRFNGNNRCLDLSKLEAWVIDKYDIYSRVIPERLSYTLLKRFDDDSDKDFYKAVNRDEETFNNKLKDFMDVPFIAKHIDNDFSIDVIFDEYSENDEDTYKKYFYTKLLFLRTDEAIGKTIDSIGRRAKALLRKLESVHVKDRNMYSSIPRTVDTFLSEYMTKGCEYDAHYMGLQSIIENYEHLRRIHPIDYVEADNEAAWGYAERISKIEKDDNKEDNAHYYCLLNQKFDYYWGIVQYLKALEEVDFFITHELHMLDYDGEIESKKELHFGWRDKEE